MPKNVSFKDIWNFYQNANFIYSDKKEALEPYLPEIEKTWEKLLNSSNGIFKHFYNTNDEDISSSVYTAQYSDNTWIIAHATGIHDPKGVHDNIVSLINFGLENEKCEYGRFLYRPTNSWPRRVFGSLMNKLDKESFEFRLYDYYMGNFNGQIQSNKREGLVIDYLKPEEYKKFEEEISKHHSSFFIDSKCLRANSIDLKDTVKRYSEEGLNRKRDILVLAGT